MTITDTNQETAFMARIRLRARRRVLWLRNVWKNSEQSDQFPMSISHEDVDRTLSDPSELRAAELDFYAHNRSVKELNAQIEHADSEMNSDGLFLLLRHRLGINEYERDLLSLTLAAEFDPQIQRVFGYLNDDTNPILPTPLLAAQLFSWPEYVRFGPDCGLVRWLLAQPVDPLRGATSLSSPWAADTFAASFFTSPHSVDRTLGSAAYHGDTHSVLPKLYETELGDAMLFYNAMHQEALRCRSLDLPEIVTELEIVGQPGSGRRTFAAQYCHEIGKNLLIADAGKLMGSDTPVPTGVANAVRTIRSAHLTDSLVYWHDADRVDPMVWRDVHNFPIDTIYGTSSPLPPVSSDARGRKRVTLQPLTRVQRCDLWSFQCELPVPRPVEDWILTPGDIKAAVLVAPAGEQSILSACRKPPAGIAGTLVTSLPCPHIWDDLILPPAVKEHLGELVSQTRNRWHVYEELNYQRLCSSGRGITALFAGPSGTGKTMAAQVLARELELELYRVDLASVMSKYIGETEKNLKLIFDDCDRANVLLFFDEADALFGQRTQVKDAHDRFANIEIDYLLQRMEQFDGIAVLATNRKGEIDKAFLRRIRFIVDFTPPGPAERLTLWKVALPESTTNGTNLVSDIDWQLLADKINLTGADIKAAALGAAFLAYAEQTPITMRHIVHAARRESTKSGGVIRDLQEFDNG